MTVKYYTKGTDPAFDLCLPFILKEEGGNSNDPQDHGGRTSRGIIQREFDAWRDEHGQERGDVFKAMDEEIHSIYYFGTKQDHYWLPRCPTLGSGVDLMYFNIAVNGGHGEADKILMRSIGGMNSDTIEKMGVNLENFYRGLRQFPRYGNVWLGRTKRCLALARTMVNKPKEKPKMDAPTLNIPITPISPPPKPKLGVPTTMHIDFHAVEQGLESVARFLPVAATFVPQLKPFLAVVPLAEGVLKMIDELQKASQAGGGAGDFALIVQSHLHAIADNVKDLVDQHKLSTPLLSTQANTAASQVGVGVQQGSGG